jgi:hypothetical protein
MRMDSFHRPRRLFHFPLFHLPLANMSTTEFQNCSGRPVQVVTAEPTDSIVRIPIPPQRQVSFVQIPISSQRQS